MDMGVLKKCTETDMGVGMGVEHLHFYTIYSETLIIRHNWESQFYGGLVGLVD